MTFQHEIKGKIRHHECDARGELKLHCILDRLQDAAAEHAAILNVGMNELAEMQLIWVLSRLKLALERPLLLGEMLTVVTRPTGIQRIFAQRCYELLVDDQRVGVAGSFWLPVNVASGRPVNVKKVLPPEIMELPEAERFFSDMDKLPPVSIPATASYLVGAGDIDLNCHLNNAVYARWISDVIGEKIGSKSPRIKEIQLNYLSSGQMGDTVDLRYDLQNDGRFIIGGEKSDGSAVFQAAGIAEK